jgi:topoisomerase-4 subunit A
MVKRFMIESASNNKVLVITEDEGSQMEIVSTDMSPEVEIVFKDKAKRNKKVKLADFIEVKGWKARGNKLTEEKIREVNLLKSNEPPRDLEAKIEKPEEEEESPKDKKAKGDKKKPGKEVKKGKKGKGKQGTLF